MREGNSECLAKIRTNGFAGCPTRHYGGHRNATEASSVGQGVTKAKVRRTDSVSLPREDKAKGRQRGKGGMLGTSLGDGLEVRLGQA